MKKISVCLLLAAMLLAVLALSASAASAGEVTLEMLAEANSAEKLLENHQSYCFYNEYEGESFGGTYTDSELCYMHQADNAMIYANGQEGELSDGAFVVRLYAGVQPDLEWTLGLVMTSPEEEVIEVVEEEEKLIVKTRSSLLAYGEEIEGGYCEYIYEVDPEQLFLLGGSYTSYTPEGVASIYTTWHVEYDVERPAQAQELLERVNPQQDYRTVTIVLDPGTENETVCLARTCRGDYAEIHLGEEYSTLYSDAECTQPFAGGSDPSKDITLYASKAE